MLKNIFNQKNIITMILVFLGLFLVLSSVKYMSQYEGMTGGDSTNAALQQPTTTGQTMTLTKIYNQF